MVFKRPFRPLVVPIISLLVRPSHQDTTGRDDENGGNDAARTTAEGAAAGGGYVPPQFSCSPTKSSCTTSEHECLANPNHPQATTDVECLPCQSSDQSYWPCDVDNLCYCRDKSRPRIPPAPSTRLYNGGEGLDVNDGSPCDEILTLDVFNNLAPEAGHPYTYLGFCDAVREYNSNHPTEGIFNMGTEYQIRSELAAFLGNALHESDEFKAGREYLMCADSLEMGGEVYCRPCDASSFDWDAMKCPPGASLASEGRPFNGYCQSNLLPPEGCECDDVYERSSNGTMAGYVRADSMYLGRGSIQLSWNYNYIRASVALTGAPQTFCQRPDLVATEEKYAWGAGLYYWMENVKNDRTCHQSVLLDDDFGGTLDNINGGLECPADDFGWHGKAVVLRLNRYCRAASAIGGLERLSKFDGCLDMKDRMRQCLDEGTCHDCVAWEGTMDLGSGAADGEGREDGTTMDIAADDVGGRGGGRAKASKQEGGATTAMATASTTTSTIDEGGGGGGRAKSSKRPRPQPGDEEGEMSETESPTPTPSSDATSEGDGGHDTSIEEGEMSDTDSSTPTPSSDTTIADIASTPSPTGDDAYTNTDPPSIVTTPAKNDDDGGDDGTISRPRRTRRPTSSPTSTTTSTTTDDYPSSSSVGSAASQFVGGMTQEGTGSSEEASPPAAASTDQTSHASQFASMTHMKGDDDDPASIVEGQEGRPTTTESSRPATAAVMKGMTNWANTALNPPPPPTAPSTDEPTSSLSTFMPTNSPVGITNLAEAFREHHGEDAFIDETEVLEIDDSMTRGNDVDPPHLTESYATASYLDNVEDGPHASFPTGGIPMSKSDESEPSGTICPGDVRTCPDGSYVSREIGNECNFAPCLDRANTDTGHFYPVWESSGIVICVDGASPPSWASGAYLKQTKSDCCLAYSMLRIDECLLG